MSYFEMRVGISIASLLMVILIGIIIFLYPTSIKNPKHTLIGTVSLSQSSQPLTRSISSSPVGGVSSSVSSVLTKNEIESGQPNQAASPYSLLLEYIKKLPDLHLRKSDDLMYSTTVEFNESQLAYFKELADKGSPTAKLYYANRMSIPTNRRFYEELSANGKVNDFKKWRDEYAEIQRLLIDAAGAGEYMAAVQLTMIPPVQVVEDKEELLTWSLIADKMGNAGGQSTMRTCVMLRDSCNEEALTRSVERALMYIDLYKIR